MSKEMLENKILEIAQMALDESWSDVQGCAEVLAREILAA